MGARFIRPELIGNFVAAVYRVALRNTIQRYFIVFSQKLAWKNLCQLAPGIQYG